MLSELGCPEQDSTEQDIGFDYIDVDPHDNNERRLNISCWEGQVPVLVFPDEDGSEVMKVGSNRIVDFLNSAYQRDVGLIPDNVRSGISI